MITVPVIVGPATPLLELEDELLLEVELVLLELDEVELDEELLEDITPVELDEELEDDDELVELDEELALPPLLSRDLESESVQALSAKFTHKIKINF